MTHDVRLGDTGKAGLMIAIGALTLLFGMLIAEFLFPGYDVSENMISDLGAFDLHTGSAIVFNVAIVIFGILAAYGGWVLRDIMDKRLGDMLILAGIGAVLVGVFNEHSIIEIHYLGAIMAFLLGAIAVVLSTRHIGPRALSNVFIVMAGISFVSLFTLGIVKALQLDGLGLGPGAIERLIAYPIIYWAVAFGAYLVCSDAREA